MAAMETELFKVWPPLKIKPNIPTGWSVSSEPDIARIQLTYPFNFVFSVKDHKTLRGVSNFTIMCTPEEILKIFIFISVLEGGALGSGNPLASSKSTVEEAEDDGLSDILGESDSETSTPEEDILSSHMVDAETLKEKLESIQKSVEENNNSKISVDDYIDPESGLVTSKFFDEIEKSDESEDEEDDEGEEAILGVGVTPYTPVEIETILDSSEEEKAYLNSLGEYNYLCMVKDETDGKMKIGLALARDVKILDIRQRRIRRVLRLHNSEINSLKQRVTTIEQDILKLNKIDLVLFNMIKKFHYTEENRRWWDAKEREVTLQ